LLYKICSFVFIVALVCPSFGEAGGLLPRQSHSVSSTFRPGYPNQSPRARVAIIIDDLGMSLAIARSFLNLPIALSFSILPKLPYSRRIAEIAHSKKRDVLCHIPMEPHRYPRINAGAYSLLTSMDPLTMEETLKSDLASIPYAIGANNHMGSKLTEDGKAMKLVMGTLREEDLFFIDSRTSAHSKAYTIAREMGLRTARRNVFLDNRKDRNFIQKQFRKLKKIALSRGNAIGIGHPHPATLFVLKEMIPRFERSGIRFVFVSTLAHSKASRLEKFSERK